MAGMESFQLLNMEDDEELTHIPLERNPSKKFRASGPPGRRTSDGSLESLHFTFDNGRTGARFAQPRSWTAIVRPWMIAAVISVLCVVIGFLACKATQAYGSRPELLASQMDWRERIKFLPDFARCPAGFADRPPLLVVSMDGLQADLVERMNSLLAVGAAGLRAPYMRPVFPTATFPNHFSIVTGLYPESHGIIDNEFWDGGNLSHIFHIDSHTGTQFDPSWWKGIPIWQLAQEHGQRVLAHYWPGSEVQINGMTPTTYVNFSTTESVESRVKVLIDALLLPKDERYHLLLTYFHKPDSIAHYNGTHGAEYSAALASADQLAELLMKGLVEHNLLDCVDVLFISDHGVADYDVDVNPTVRLRKMLDEEKWDNTKIHQGLGSIMRIDPFQSGWSVQQMMDSLSCPNDSSPYQVYMKQDLPRRVHYANSDRISPIILTPNISIGLHTHQPPKDYKIWATAMHGWDNIYARMRASFIAYGPSFLRHVPMQPFPNVELFGLFCQLLGLNASSNNGTVGSLNYILRNPRNFTHGTSGGDRIGVGKVYGTVADLGIIDLVVCGDVNSSTHLSEKQKSDLRSADPSADDFVRYHFGRLGVPLPPSVDVPRASPDFVFLADFDFASGYSRELNVALWTAFQLKLTSTTPDPDQKTAVGAYFAGLVRKVYRASDSVKNIHCSASGTTHPNVPAYFFPPELARNSVDSVLRNLSSNTVTMHQTFKTGVWKRFWDLASSWITSDRPLRVVIGPVFDSFEPFGQADHFDMRRPGRRQTALPLDEDQLLASHFYVILSRPALSPECATESCQHEVMSFVLPHKEADTHPCQKDGFYFLTHSATVRDIELLTGLEFFSGLAVDEAARLKTRLTDALWGDQTL
ncbi:Ectonucleotide pyrophosphatase/phosphodiesterase family member 1 [Hypsibius exemplaris]|uniref:Ectonucleotide pyrophosphatase/phosphodiesterase family member 1 n=1 Tax=Hypsibius exemplaris TaxID=2072580 RepID=A0A1W0X802_HYPEX|nr:Ectonucleotide pyrophosphatase/phosphodiesterase family member 1 [Hypsibius exemplaris]